MFVKSDSKNTIQSSSPKVEWDLVGPVVYSDIEQPNAPYFTYSYHRNPLYRDFPASISRVGNMPMAKSKTISESRLGALLANFMSICTEACTISFRFFSAHALSAHRLCGKSWLALFTAHPKSPNMVGTSACARPLHRAWRLARTNLSSLTVNYTVQTMSRARDSLALRPFTRGWLKRAGTFPASAANLPHKFMQ